MKELIGILEGFGLEASPEEPVGYQKVGVLQRAPLADRNGLIRIDAYDSKVPDGDVWLQIYRERVQVKEGKTWKEGRIYQYWKRYRDIAQMRSDGFLIFVKE